MQPGEYLGVVFSPVRVARAFAEQGGLKGRTPAVVQRRRIGSGSPIRSSQFITMSAAHSLGRKGLVGPCSSEKYSSRFRNPSGRASCSGRMSRSNRTTPPTAPTATRVSRSRVVRAGKRFTGTRVRMGPRTAGGTREGSRAAPPSRG
jgi:hypothetical protein